MELEIGKKKCTGKADDIGQALHTWFTDAHARVALITSSIMVQKAMQFAAVLGKTDFNFTTQHKRL